MSRTPRPTRSSSRDRVTVVVIEQASHAVIVEQPEAVSAALITYARKLWPHSTLQ